MQLLHQLFHHHNLEIIRQYLGTYGYWFLLLGTIFEGELVLLMAGFFAYLGLMNFALVLLVGFSGATLGDNIWFMVGRHGGTPFIQRFGKFFFLTEKRIARAKKYFDEHGTKTIFFSRFVFGTRISSAVLAGALQMPQRKFIKSNVSGAGVWAIITASLGYLFGSSVILLHQWLRRTELTLLILAIVIVIILLLRIFITSTRDI